ncbi:putative potassium channel protein [Diplogelasinospora grovesii]|uniref:Potassium channel protein n=1 Tax=Diplogelasinospora grovesii TaxID=303347 RepID=A0AAN6N7C2_9PEZI|nr:putative potassium channel protein [Diplogelasinospora grovesii]
MNDASGENIHEHFRALEENSKEVPERMENDRAHLDPSRWWFASSAFPMIAGTLGPVASAFSICALVKPWRQSYPPASDVTKAPFIPDPIWLTTINAVQLAIALGANLALLLNMTRRLRFSIAQPVTIVGWYVSSLALTALTATASGPLLIQPTANYIWSQAFYYGIYSAVVYFVVASLMVVTFLGAQRGHYDKDFMLTPSQRTLMLQTISFLVYLLVGALVFSKMENWNYLDAVYWAAVTLFTVGFGDFYAQTTLGRALLFPYALIGVISLGLVIGSIRSLVLERGKRRLDARMVEKKRRKMVRQMTLKGKDDVLIPIRDGAQRPSMSPRSTMTGLSGRTEFERREEEFNLMRKIQESAQHRRRWVAMGISTSTWLALWLLGAKVFQECEKPYQQWNYFEAFYFAFVSLTTIGYGDITPVSNAGKSFWVFWALLALPTMTVLISNAGDTIVKGIRDATDRIGQVTILPGEQGFAKDFKQILRMLSCGKLFDEDIEESPPGFLGDAHLLDLDDDEGGGDEAEGMMQRDQDELDAERAPTDNGNKEKQDRKDNVISDRNDQKSAEENKRRDSRAVTFDENVNSPRQRGMWWPTNDSASSTPNGNARDNRRESRSSNNSRQMLPMQHAVSIPRQTLPEIPTDPAEYHVTLIEEISRVTHHMRRHPPRKYTFQEWAWYLRLIGEDEGSADRHRKAQPHTHGKKNKQKDMNGTNTDGSRDAKKDGEGETKAQDAVNEQWSWVGSRSPLMGSQEEAEWILEKLTLKLTDELRGVSRQEKEGKKIRRPMSRVR